VGRALDAILLDSEMAFLKSTAIISTGSMATGRT